MVFPAQEEHPTPLLRWNVFEQRGGGVTRGMALQQQWLCRAGYNTWTEWRDVPVVDEPLGIKTPADGATMD